MEELPVWGKKPNFNFSFKMNILFLSALVSVMLSSCVQPLPDDARSTYDVLYTAGTEAYTQERWYECMSLMQKALQDFHHYHNNLADCRVRCQNSQKSHVDSTQHSELAFFETVLLRSNCLRRCKQKKLGARVESVVGEDIKNAFATFLPYDYLQICAYKVRRLFSAWHAFKI